MIEKMNMVHIVTTASKKDAMLTALREAGIVHLAERKGADRTTSERFSILSKAAADLKEYRDPKASSMEILDDADFEKLFSGVQAAFSAKAQLTQEISAAAAELERIQEWGDFIPEELRELKKSGFDFHFYRIGAKELETAKQDENIRLIRLSSIDKMEAVAVLGTLPAELSASEFELPEKGISELNSLIAEKKAALAETEDVLKKASLYDSSFKQQLVKAQNEVNFSAAGQTAQSDDLFVWLSGYIPADEADNFRRCAEAEKWAYAIGEVSDDDDAIPTKVRYNKLTGLIKPVFDILGVLPGYREQDVSLWFLLFFALFFAMILGDAGYGALILAGTIAFNVKTKKSGDAVFLLYVLSITTIVWGALTGTWFGMESAMEVPILKALVVPAFANYPDKFGVSAVAQQNTIMKFAFSIGAIHMILGSVLSIRKKIAEKNLSWVADLGWIISILGMYFLSLTLVIGEAISMTMIFGLIITAFVLVVLFGGMSPDKTFGEGIKAGLGDAFTTFLNTISCFGNVMSYIRLFAVGMAGLAIAQSFNNMAAGMGEGPMIIFGALIVIIGHALNLVMGFLSVVVHGVRLNVLEFSGQAGIEWTGIAYDPFKVEDKVNNQ